MSTRDELKVYFETGNRPTQAEYEDLIDSMKNDDDYSSGATNPTVTFDEANGYEVTDRYINETSKEEFVCLDNTTGNAVWKSTTGLGDASLTAQSGADIPITMGDDAGANGVNFKNESGSIVSSLTSEGDLETDGGGTFEGKLVGNIPEWSVDKDYLVDEQTSYAGILYKSIDAPNINQQPDSAPLYWEKVVKEISDYDEVTTFDEETDDLLISSGRIKTGNLLIGPNSKAGQYSSTYSYSTEEITNFNGTFYISLQDDNVDNQPDTSPTYWEEYGGGLSKIARNYATNPIMLVAERPGDFDSAYVRSDGGEYSIDRFKTIGTTNSQNILRKDVDQPSELNYSKSLKVISYEASVSKVMGIEQRLDDLIPFVCNGGSWVFSAKVKTSNANAKLAIYNGTTYTLSEHHTGGGGWELLSVTCELTSASILSIQAVLCDVTAGPITIVENDWIETTEWNFHPGDTRIEFDYRDEESEKWECMRYCWNFKPAGTRLGLLGFGRANSTIYAINFFMHTPRKMVDTPTVSLGGAGGAFPGGDWIIESNNGSYGDILIGIYPVFNQRSSKGFEMTWEIKDPPGTSYSLWTVGEMIFLRMYTNNAYILVDADY